MKTNARIISCDTKNPSELNGKKYYKTQFVDEEGLTGYIYPSKPMNFGDEVVVELVLDGGKFKFKVRK